MSAVQEINVEKYANCGIEVSFRFYAGTTRIRSFFGTFTTTGRGVTCVVQSLGV